MAPPQHFSPRKVLLLLTFFLLFLASMCISASCEVQSHKNGIFGKRKLLGVLESDEDDESVVIKKKSSTSSSSSSSSVLSKDSKPKNQTKILKSNTLSSAKNQTKFIKASSIGLSAKNQTKVTNKTSNGSSSTKDQAKLIKASSIGLSAKNQTKVTNKTSNGSSSTKDQAKLIKLSSESARNKTKKLTKASSDSGSEDQPIIKTKLKKLNSTSKATNSTKTASLLTKKSTDLTKLSSAKNKTVKATASRESKSLLDEDSVGNESKPKSSANSDKKSKPVKNKPSEEKPKSGGKSGKQTWPSWVDQDDDEDDLVSEFKALPSKFQETLLPDLERISQTSKVYLKKANKEITRGFKPYVGNKYAPTIASFISFAFVIIPLVLVSLIFNKIKVYFSLQKILIFIQIYLSIYFTILCFSSLITGLEPLKFFYATSQATYVCLQLLQMLAYVLYLLLLLMYLILVFSTETGLGTKLLGLIQTFVGYAIGLHYYVTVFHMAVLHQPPKTSWKIHAIYAMCFLVICVLTRVDYRRKKEYLDGDESKMS